MTIEEELAYYRKKYGDELREKWFKYIKNGKSYSVKLPNKVPFTSYGTGLLDRPEPFEAVAFRRPMAGEYYLSGAGVSAYKAPNDLSTEYVIVERTQNDK